MISSGLVATSVLSFFEKAGWVVKHRFDYNPVLISRLGFGDRRFFKSEDDPAVRLPEPTLALLKGARGIICEIDYKYTKGSFSALNLIKNTKRKKAYIEKYFGRPSLKQIIYGLALPDLPLHVDRARAHLDEVDFLLVACKNQELFKIKNPSGAWEGAFSQIPRLPEKKGQQRNLHQKSRGY